MVTIFFLNRFYNGPDYPETQKCSCKDSVDGKMKEFGADEQLWCCNGQVQNLTEQCPNQGKCNYHPRDEYRNGRFSWYASRSYIDLCEDKR